MKANRGTVWINAGLLLIAAALAAQQGVDADIDSSATLVVTDAPKPQRPGFPHQFSHARASILGGVGIRPNSERHIMGDKLWQQALRWVRPQSLDFLPCQRGQARLA